MAQECEDGDRQGEAAKPAQVIRLVLLVHHGRLAGRAAYKRRRHVLRLALAVTHHSPPSLRGFQPQPNRVPAWRGLLRPIFLSLASGLKREKRAEASLPAWHSLPWDQGLGGSW